MYRVKIGIDYYIFREAVISDKQQILDLYSKAIGTDGCTWSQDYPNEDICIKDIVNHNLFCLLNDRKEIIGAISVDCDDEVDSLECWNKDAGKMAELARLVVKEQYQNIGIAPRLINNTAKILKTRQYKTIHYLVSKDNKKAIASYKKMNFNLVGESDILQQNWYCYEKNIEDIDDDKNYMLFTIPNILSFFRLILAVMFLFLYKKDGNIQDNLVAVLILILSGITDFFDGKIARRFNLISELGKIIDPISDKVTEGIITICLVTKYKILIILLVVFVIKELFMSICGILILKKTDKNEGAKWYGKVSTFMFYVIMIALLLIPGINKNLADLMIIICTVMMTFAFVMYAKQYYMILNNNG